MKEECDNVMTDLYERIEKTSRDALPRRVEQTLSEAMVERGSEAVQEQKREAILTL